MTLWGGCHQGGLFGSCAKPVDADPAGQPKRCARSADNAAHAAQAPASAISFDELQGLTYLQVKGSGIANTCPVIDSGSSNLKDIKAGNYKINKLCLEPTSFTVKEESQFKGSDSEFVPTKLMTRLTYTLDEVRSGNALCTLQFVQQKHSSKQAGLALSDTPRVTL